MKTTTLSGLSLLLVAAALLTGCDPTEAEEGTDTKTEETAGKNITFNVHICNDIWTPKNKQPYLGTESDEMADIKIYKGDTLVDVYRTSKQRVAKVSLKSGAYTYTVKSEQGKKNISKDGYIIGGIFTSQEEVDSYLGKTADAQHPGDLKFCDINGDGIINGSDAVERVSLTVGEDTTVEVYIATINFTPVYGFSYEEKKLAMTQFYREMLATACQMDAAMTHEADVPNFARIANFSFDADDGQVSQLWTKSYQVIHHANTILERVFYLDNVSESKKREYNAEALYYRAYAYSILLSYFGGVPAVLSMNIGVNTDIQRSEPEEIANRIAADCDEVCMLAPADGEVSRYAALQVKARAQLCSPMRNYSAAISTLTEIINSGAYALPANKEWGGDAISEGISYSTAEYPGAMRKGDSVYPVRYTETLLLFAEASNELGNTSAALQTINQLQAWQGLPEIAALTKEELRVAIDNLRTTLLSREGQAFARLIRANKFLEVLGTFGATEKHKLLPIPRSEMAANPLLSQNPGW
ncbi:MAG: RagB/SusD family nutrient uptake outer membrane protein [Prevotellaceae bacterium]|jgi:hypothetical protein|nr:RagB/SusD family nutrient uptake outer membrane protein [Prevotellaceae bacterium]